MFSVLGHVLHEDILECRFLYLQAGKHAAAAISRRGRGGGVNEDNEQPYFVHRTDMDMQCGRQMLCLTQEAFVTCHLHVSLQTASFIYKISKA